MVIFNLQVIYRLNLLLKLAIFFTEYLCQFISLSLRGSTYQCIAWATLNNAKCANRFHTVKIELLLLFFLNFTSDCFQNLHAQVTFYCASFETIGGEIGAWWKFSKIFRYFVKNFLCSDLAVDETKRCTIKRSFFNRFFRTIG